jgi:sorbitol-6-phosphate 2-dehydrogenase
MELLHAAPFLRGLAMNEVDPAGDGRAVVTTAALGGTLPAGAVIVDLPDGSDEAGMKATLRSAAAGGVCGRLFALRSDGSGLLMAAASNLDDAKAILRGDRAAAYGVASQKQPRKVGTSNSALAPGMIPGAAAGREHVVAGKTALVTGGAQGFGEEIVRGLVASGALVFIADLNLAGAERLAAELNAERGGTAAIPLAIDVSSEQSVAVAFAAITAVAGGLDLVVSNAGVLKAGSVLEQSLADFEFVTRVNYTAFFLVAKHAGLMMKRQRAGAPAHRADIIQINSKSGLEGSNKNGAYAGSKFGGIGLVQSFALELVEHGIKVNAICPGHFFHGPLWSDPDRGLFVQYLRTGKVPGAKTIADVKASYEAKVPMGRGCEGPDVMRAIYYLVEQRYETGQALPVTGGQVMLN